jgi:DHA2 family multidrug resistance protein
MPSEPPPLGARGWIGFAFMLFGTFMAVLDIQIVAGSIGELQAGLSASRDEISTVQTAYLIAEVIGIALAGFLGRAFGTRLLFTIAAVSFCVSSFMCALTWDLPSLVVFRALQGFSGAPMIPMTVATVFTVFPRRQQMMANAMMAFSINAASAMGPVLGGFITNALGWRALFWLNFVPGMAAAIVVWVTMRKLHLPGPKFELLKKLDLIGLVAMSLFLGAGEYVLEQGPTHDWFVADELKFWGVLCVVGAAVFFWRALTRENPIVDLKPFSKVTFAIGATLMLLVGGCLFGSVFLTPLFLNAVRGYNSMQVGETMWLQGISMMICAPLVGQFGRTMTDLRAFAVFGLFLIVLSCVLQARLTSQAGFWDLALPQVLRGAGLTVTFNAMLGPAMQSLPPSLIHAGASLISTMRNLGGAFGIAALTTIQSHALAFHRQELYSAASAANPHINELIAGIQAHIANTGGADPARQALMYYAAILDREALVMAFNDEFLALAIVLAVSSVAVLFMRPRAPATMAAPPSQQPIAVEAAGAN